MAGETPATGDASPPDPDATGAAPSGPVNNPTPDPANDSGGSPPVLSQLYDTLGSVQSGLDVRAQEAEEDKKRLLEQEKTLLQERAEAEQADDTDRFNAITADLEQLWEAWGVLNGGDEEPDAQPESEDGDGDSDKRGRSGDDPGTGRAGLPVAAEDGRGELRGGPDGGPPDDQQ